MMMAQTSLELSPRPDPNTNEEIQENNASPFFADRGCCFWIPCFRSGHRSKSRLWGRIPASEDLREDTVERWWARPLLKMREWSELVAGPKWKTFIRQFNKGRPSSRQGKLFQYDPLSYALNFDEGPAEDADLEDDRLRRDFSMRYAAIPVGAMKSSSGAGDFRNETTS